jgi:hypothetical protein
MATDLNNTRENSQQQKSERSRETYRRARLQEIETKLNNESEQKSSKKIRIRLIPIWLRLVLIAILVTISVMSGIAVGYGVIGDGKVSDAFEKSTWQHVVDLINKDSE